MLHDKGIPSIVQRTLVRPPAARVGPLTPTERAWGGQNTNRAWET